MGHTASKRTGEPKTVERITAVFQAHGALTIGDVAQLTGIHAQRVRSIVRPPRFRRAGKRGQAEQWEMVPAPTS
jgi:phage antirepressor YoqD-like protein